MDVEPGECEELEAELLEMGAATEGIRRKTSFWILPTLIVRRWRDGLDLKGSFRGVQVTMLG